MLQLVKTGTFRHSRPLTACSFVLGLWFNIHNGPLEVTSLCEQRREKQNTLGTTSLSSPPHGSHSHKLAASALCSPLPAPPPMLCMLRSWRQRRDSHLRQHQLHPRCVRQPAGAVLGVRRPAAEKTMV